MEPVINQMAEQVAKAAKQAQVDSQNMNRITKETLRYMVAKCERQPFMPHHFYLLYSYIIVKLIQLMEATIVRGNYPAIDPGRKYKKMTCTAAVQAIEDIQDRLDTLRKTINLEALDADGKQN